MKDKYVLVSFCNIPVYTTSPLAVLQISEKQGNLVSYAPVALGYAGPLKTATGLTSANGKIFVLFTTRDGKTYVAALKERDLSPLFHCELPEIKDGHSILALRDCLYVVSTGTDEIICYDIKDSRVENPRVVWHASNTKQDTHHVNSIIEYNGDVLISAFGRKKGELWTTASNGYIFNITSNSLITDGIHHPHSLSIKNDKIYYSDSNRNAFCMVGDPEPIFDLNGYARGITWLSDDIVCLAISIGRKVSKSTGRIANPADPGEPAGECGLVIGKVSNKEVLEKIDLSWFGPEIYDTLILPETAADLLSLSNTAQRSERQTIDIFSRELNDLRQQTTRQIQELSSQLAGREQRLQEILNSRAWKLVQYIRGSYEVIAPFGSTRDTLIQLVFRTALIGRQQGLKAILRQAYNWAWRSTNGWARLSSRSVRSRRSYISIPGLSQALREKAKKIESSGFFDHEWYLQDNPDVRISRINPVEHYLTMGLSIEKNPNPLFNTSIYVKSADENVEPEDALLHFVESDRLFAPGAYRNAEILLTAQQNYLKELDMEYQDRRSIPKRFAVFFQCGSGSVHKEWLTENSKDWDLLINHYDETYLNKISCDVEFQQTGKKAGTKSTAFHMLLERWPQLLEPYDYVLLLDDDILLEEKDISRLFHIASEHNLHLAQASLSSNSNCAHQIFKNPGKTGIRYVDGVEIMMPLLSKRAIDVGRHLFRQAISGWGVDFVLGKLLSAKGGAAIIDDVIVWHTKPINVEEGAFYRMLHEAYIYPEIELTNLQRIYGVGRAFNHV
ncbi:MAG TPA: DUF707 domain-containing protein [Anaerolineales bacterium]|nr:DUF707 domain-containing protein [Anaerolineales bacterium]